MMIATFLTHRFCYKCLVKELQCQPRTPLLFEQPSWQATPIMNLGNNSTDVTKNSRNVTKNKLRKSYCATGLRFEVSPTCLTSPLTKQCA